VSKRIFTAGLSLVLVALAAPTVRAEGGFFFGFHASYCCGCNSGGFYYTNHPCSGQWNPYGFPPPPYMDTTYSDVRALNNYRAAPVPIYTCAMSDWMNNPHYDHLTGYGQNQGYGYGYGGYPAGVAMQPGTTAPPKASKPAGTAKPNGAALPATPPR
jgi:hypothetical protein